MSEGRDNNYIPPELIFPKGERLVCRNNMSAHYHLTQGEVYEVLKETEPGIFPSDPYITVISDMGEPYVCHAHRFELEKTA